MNRRKVETIGRILRWMLVIPVFAGWIGFLYPDLTFENEVCKAYTNTGEERTELSGEELYRELLRAEPGQIRVKSRLLEFIFTLD